MATRGGPHLLELRNRFVVSFCILDAAKREPDQRSDDQDHKGPKLYVRIHFVGALPTSIAAREGPAPIQLVQQTPNSWY